MSNPGSCVSKCLRAEEASSYMYTGPPPPPRSDVAITLCEGRFLTLAVDLTTAIKCSCYLNNGATGRLKLPRPTVHYIRPKQRVTRWRVMARGRVTAAYDSWLAVPFCLVLLVVGPSTALSQCCFTTFGPRSPSDSSNVISHAVVLP